MGSEPPLDIATPDARAGQAPDSSAGDRSTNGTAPPKTGSGAGKKGTKTKGPGDSSKDATSKQEAAMLCIQGCQAALHGCLTRIRDGGVSCQEELKTCMSGCK